MLTTICKLVELLKNNSDWQVRHMETMYNCEHKWCASNKIEVFCLDPAIYPYNQACWLARQACECSTMFNSAE